MSSNPIIRVIARGILLLAVVPLLLAGGVPTASASNTPSTQLTNPTAASALEPPVSDAVSPDRYRLRSAQSSDLGIASLLLLGGALLTVGTLWKRLLAKSGQPPP